MLPTQTTLRDRIRQSVAGSDTAGLSDLVASAITQTNRRARKEKITEVSAAILDAATEYNRPDLISLLPDVPHEDLRPLFSALLSQYIRTRDEAWFSAITGIVERLEKKGDQSQELAHLSRILIEAGSSQSDPFLISRGMALFSGITFRKYRSDIFSQISPTLIEWAVSRQDVEFLRSLYMMTVDIADISRRSVIHARIANAIATVAIATDNVSTWTDSIRIAADIRQKTRRQTCFATISRTAAASPLYRRVRDISGTLTLLTDLEPEVRHEVVESLLWQVIQKETEPEAISGIIATLAGEQPTIRPTIVTCLLRRAEQNGDPWYFRLAMDLQARMADEGQFPVREFVRSALAVVRATGSTDLLQEIVPAIVSSSPAPVASRILLQIVEVLLVQEKLSEALSVFALVDPAERNPHYDECIITIWKHAIAADRVADVEQALRPDGNPERSAAIYRAVSDICRQHAFSEIARQVDPLSRVMALHPQHDQLVQDSITLLIRRGFLESTDSGVLIRLTKAIMDENAREQALSTIVIRVARQGAETRNRDLLQRAVGLSCAIEDPKTRSLTLTATIDEATRLAVADGDLDLLRRMREWSASMLSPEREVTALAKIIEGMIVYAGGHCHPAALEEAYRIAQEIEDPSLRKEVTERISENFIRIGCILMQDLDTPPVDEEFREAFRLFERGLAILAAGNAQGNAPLRIAYSIDIIIDSFKDALRIDMVLPLALFILELREGYERDAMAARIVPLLRVLTEQTDSTDPYEGITDALLRISYLPGNPTLLDLVRRTTWQIKDPFIRSLQLVRVSDLYLRSGREEQARSLLEETCTTAREISGEYRQVIVLSECMIRCASLDMDTAARIMQDAIAVLRSTTYDPDAAAHRNLVRAIMELHRKRPDTGLVEIAEQVAGAIGTPVEFVSVMIPVYRMVIGNPDLRASIMSRIQEGCDAIPLTIQRAALLLELAEQMVADRDFTPVAPLLAQIGEVAWSIPVPHLADSVRLRVAEICIRIGNATGDETFYARASGIIAGINHEDIQTATAGLHEKVHAAEQSPAFREIMVRAERIVTERYNPQQLSALESMIRSLTDRGLVARYFGMIAILFNRTGRTRLARRFFDAALAEARVIRPLSRRTYVLCDMALVLDRAGCSMKGQEVMGFAVDAATGIRQFRDRDEVFDNLAAAMRWMQGERPA
ncbi:MAG TPA: hypothetical protein P5217_04905 [Methanoregulaceae archaeon]|nr:hypothetical protein [Methanoregulaceae archaeon]HRY75602.1 hypothetical protein [Methanoregulaceae archaeon]